MAQEILCGVACLPTTQPSRLYLGGQLEYSYHPSTETDGSNQFLYITELREARKGEYFLLGKEELNQVVTYQHTDSFLGKVPVVIATTDPGLGIVARPSNMFLKKYAQLFFKKRISAVSVEFQENNPRLAPDGTVTIRPLK